MPENLSRFHGRLWVNFFKTFGNVSETFGDLSVIYVIPAYEFRLEISFEILENANNNIS